MNRGRLRRTGPRTRIALAVALAAAATAARADGASALIEPSFLLEDSTVTDQALRTTHTHTESLSQKYRLTADKDLFRNLNAAVGGTFQDDKTQIVSDTYSQHIDDRILNAYARVTLGTPILTGGAEYDLRQAWPSAFPGTLVNEMASAQIVATTLADCE